MTCLYPCTLGKKGLMVTCLATKFTCPGLPDVTSFELSEERGGGGELGLENKWVDTLQNVSNKSYVDKVAPTPPPWAAS